MVVSKINISTINVELTDKRRQVIQQKLAPLNRLLVHEDDVDIQVVLRSVRSSFRTDMLYVSVKVITEQDTFMAVTSGLYLARVVSGAREMLRRSISRGPSVTESESPFCQTQGKALGYALSMQS